MPAGSVRYCGSSFGLDLRRHRLFASNVALAAPPCDHGWQTPRFVSLDWDAARVGRRATVVGVFGNLHGEGDSWELRQRAMGIGWLRGDALNQALPPAYTAHIGAQLLAASGASVAGGYTGGHD
jgi:DNA (cytosine-5)-methyltransferase 1